VETVANLAMLEGPLEATSEGILLLDRGGNVVWFNRRVGELFGMSPERRVGRRGTTFHIELPRRP
jgi:PAS domain S-box-containing protein